MMDKLNPRPDEPQTWINTIWEALDHARDSYTDEQWDQICMAMAWNAEFISMELDGTDYPIKERE
jgi:hypothetical protein